MAGQTDLARLVVSLEARLDKFDKVMAKAVGTTNKTAAQIEGRFRKVETNLSNFGKGFSAALAAKFFRDLISNVAQLADDAKRAGVAVEDLQAAIFAARQEGGNAESIVAAFSKLNLELGEAATKGNELGKILAANNIALKELQGDPVKAMLTIADLMKNAANEQARAVIGNAAFGKSFKEILPFLMQGSSAIKDAMQAARDLGAVMSEELVNKSKEFDDLLTATADVTFTKLRAAALEVAFAIKEWGPAAQAMLPALSQAQDIMDSLTRGDFRRAFFGKSGVGVAGGLGDLLLGARPEVGDLTISRNPFDLKSRGSAARGGVTKDAVQLTDAQKKSAREAERQAKAIADVIKNLELERLQLTRTARDQAIYNELAKAGVTIDSQHGKVIAELAGNFYDEQTALQNLTDELDFARDATKGFFSDLISGLREGASLTDTLSKAFSNLADKMIDKILDQAVDQLLGPSGTPGAGIVGKLLSLAAPSSAAPGAGAIPTISRNPFDIMRSGIAPLIPVTGGPLRTLVPKSGTVISPVSSGGSSMPFGDIIQSAASKYGISPNLLAGLIKQESRFNPNAVSPAGAMGLTQLMPGTARDLGVRNPFDPSQNVFGGADYLSQMLKLSGGNVPGALARYNWGPGNFANKGGMANLPQETQTYIANVTKYQQQFAGSVQEIAETAKTSASGFSGAFPQALQQVVGAAGGPGGGGGLLSLIPQLLGGFGGSGTYATRGGGGPVSKGRGYIVGEHGAEFFVPRIPGVIKPRTGGWNGGGDGQIGVHVTPSKYFDVHVERVSGAGDARTLSSARRNFPETQARYLKLGTTGR